MTARSSLTVVLAAGEGTRMRSSLPKVLHPVAHQPLLAHVLDAAPHGTDAALAVVIGPDHKAVADEVKRVRPDAATFIQAERLGTFPVSIIPDQDCCQLFTPRHPATRVRLEQIEAAEQALPIDAMVDAAVGSSLLEELRFPVSAS